MQNAQNKKRIIIICIMVFGLLVLMVVAFIINYNQPMNVLSREISKGAVAIDESNWEEAALSFKQVIEIDDTRIDAYGGLLKAYKEQGDKKFKEFFIETINHFEEIPEDELKKYDEVVLSTYLYAEDIYEINSDEIREIYERGLALTQSDILNGKLVDFYLSRANKDIEQKNYAEALESIDKMLQLDKDKEMVQDCATRCLELYLNEMFDEHDFDGIRKYISEYEAKLSKKDFNDILLKVENVEAKEAKIEGFMQKLYDVMSKKNIENMIKIQNSNEAIEVSKIIENDIEFYLPDGSKSGTGVAIYKYEGDKVCVYYGEIKDLKMEGQGYSFVNVYKTGYKTLEGTWVNNAPSGKNKQSLIYDRFAEVGYDNYYITTVEGNMKDGLWDGNVHCTVVQGYEGVVFDVNLAKGVPTVDRTAEARALFPYADCRNVYVIFGLGEDDLYSGFCGRQSSDGTLGWCGFSTEYIH